MQREALQKMKHLDKIQLRHFAVEFGLIWNSGQEGTVCLAHSLQLKRRQEDCKY